MGIIAKAVLLGLCAMLATARADDVAKLDPDALAPIATIVDGEIRAGNIPGAVVEIGRRGSIVYRRAFG